MTLDIQPRRDREVHCIPVAKRQNSSVRGCGLVLLVLLGD